MTQDRFFPYLTSMEVAGLESKHGAIIVQPLAAVEQHGPHLPLFTDCLIAQEVLHRSLARLPDDLPLWTLPLLAYGKSTEHAAFPGTVTLSAQTLISVLKEVGASLARAGFTRFVILNAHGGNTEIVDFVIRDIRAETGMLVFALHPFLRVAAPEQGLSEAEKTYGIHAGDVETSMLLAMNPEWVRRELAPSSQPKALAELRHPPFMGALNFGWLTQDISVDGVLGDATTAEAARGELYLDAAADEVAELLLEIQGFEFNPDG